MTEFRLDDEQLRELGRFARSMVLNQGFAVHVIVSEDPELAGPALMHALSRSLDATGRVLELRCFDHQHLDAALAALDGALARHARERQLFIVNFAALPRADAAQACDLFTALNGRRDTLGTGLVGELVFIAPPWLEGPLLAAGPDLASTVRSWLLRREAMDVGPLEDWRASCDARFDELVASTKDAAERYQNGTYTFSYCFEPGAVSLPLADVQARLAAVSGYTGWRPWWVPTTKHLPRPHEGALECWMFGDEQLFAEPANSDYWRASAHGCLHLRRGYDEDSEAQAGGRVFSNSLAIWRTAEALLHVEDFARQLGLAPHRRVAFEARWMGLAGRELSSWPEKPSRMVLGSAAARAEASATVTFEPAQLPEVLVPLVGALVGPLYYLFAGARPTPAFVAEQVRRLLAR